VFNTWHSTSNQQQQKSYQLYFWMLKVHLIMCL
jgi:hypothetical protein